MNDALYSWTFFSDTAEHGPFQRVGSRMLALLEACEPSSFCGGPAHARDRDDHKSGLASPDLFPLDLAIFLSFKFQIV